jgi:hypothetical protein
MVRYIDKWDVEAIGDYEVTKCRVQLGDSTVILQITGPAARKTWRYLIRGSYIYGEGRIHHYQGPNESWMLCINTAHISVIFPQQVAVVTYPDKESNRTWCSFSGTGIFKRFWQTEGSGNWYASCTSRVRGLVGGDRMTFSVKIPESKLSWIDSGLIQPGHRLYASGLLGIASAPRSQVALVYGDIQSITQKATIHLPDFVPAASEDYQPCI